MSRPFHQFFSDKQLEEIGPYVEPVGEEATGGDVGEGTTEEAAEEDEEEHVEELSNAVVITEEGAEQVWQDARAALRCRTNKRNAIRSVWLAGKLLRLAVSAAHTRRWLALVYDFSSPCWERLLRHLTVMQRVLTADVEHDQPGAVPPLEAAVTTAGAKTLDGSGKTLPGSSRPGSQDVPPELTAKKGRRQKP